MPEITPEIARLIQQAHSRGYYAGVEAGTTREPGRGRSWSIFVAEHPDLASAISPRPISGEKPRGKPRGKPSRKQRKKWGRTPR